MAETSPSKAELRSTLRQRRNSLSPTEQLAAAQALRQIVAGLPAWPAAQRIALYLAADGEIGTRPLERLAREQGKQLFLPAIVEDNSLRFACWTATDALERNRFSIPEPPVAAARCPVSALDIVFLPLVAWDRHGGRLGMGGGFYDRTLSGIAGPLLVGLAHECQRIERVPRDPWDINLDYIATDAALYRSQAN